MSPQSGSSPRRVIVVGASGYIGRATLGALASRHSDTVQAFAGVRRPDTFEKMENVETVTADMGDKAALAMTLKGYDAAYLVIPGDIDRTQLGINGIEAAKEAGVKFLLVLSVLSVGTETIFGRQFAPIEEAAQKCGLDYAIVRLPIFMDNHWANTWSVKEQSTFYDPRDGTKMHTPVAVSDVGKACADILADPTKHVGATYHLVSPAYSLDDMAAELTKALGKEVKQTTVPYDVAKQAFLGMGFPEWQVDGIMELYKFMDDGSDCSNILDTGDIELITGEKPTTIADWVSQNAGGFM
jgi:uncharacterized protein YbjT (DUF2867 family)